jgi:hypothetical protein
MKLIISSINKEVDTEMNKNIFLRAFALKYSVGYNPFSPSGFFTSSRLITKNVLHYSHKVHFCVLQGSQNKQR